MTVPLIPSLGVGVSQRPDAMPQAPQVPEERAPTYYEQLRAVWEKSVRALHGRTANGRKYSQEQVDEFVKHNSRFRTFQGLSRELQRIEPRNADPNDMTGMERGAAARTVLFGHGALPFSDEIAGALSGAGAVAKGEPYMPAYHQGRDENRQYLANAERDQGSGRSTILGLEGAVAGGMAMGGNPSGPIPSILRGGATGAGFAGAYGLGQLPEFSVDALKQNAVPLAVGTATGGLLGATPGMMAKGYLSRFHPEAEILEEGIHAAGGPSGILARAAEAGTDRPMLSELGGTLGRQTKMVNRASAEAQERALARVQAELAKTAADKARIGARYGVLDTPINDPRINAILTRPNVQKLLRSMIDEGVAPPNELTGRALEDLRQELGQEAARRFKSGHNRIGARAREAADDLRQVLDENNPEFADIRREYSPLVRRELKLRRMVARLSREGRGMGIPVEPRPGTHNEIMRELGLEKWQREMRAANRLVDPLYTPGTPAELLHRARIGILPSLMRPGGGASLMNLPAAMGGASPQLTDPFFPYNREP